MAKGGNLAINVGPQPDGRLPRGAVECLEDMGKWLSVYGDAIYGTRVCAPYKKDGIAFTKKENLVYAIETFDKESDPVRAEVWIPYEGTVTSITMQDTGAEVEFTRKVTGYVLHLQEYGKETAPIARVFCLK